VTLRKMTTVPNQNTVENITGPKLASSNFVRKNLVCRNHIVVALNIEPR
jgi:hypothetical protein